MRFGISFKLFLAIVCSCIIIALAMGGAVRFSFERGFVSYIQEREQQRLALLAEVLEADYVREGGWTRWREDERRWRRLLRTLQREALNDGPRAPGAHADHDRSLPPRTALLDEQGALVVGRGLPQNRDAQRYALRVEDRTVGWLMTRPPPEMIVSNAVDQRFQERQLMTTWVIVGLSVLLATLVSLLFARMLLAPVRRITRATHQLARGDYTVRVVSRSSDELGRLADDFNRLAYSLERNEQLRRDMMADVSHELRTPLAVLRGEIEALQDGLREPTAQTLASLQHEVLLLSKLIDDLYELSLADAGALNYRMEPIDLAALVQDVVAVYRERFAQREIALELVSRPGLFMLGDAQRLTQLLGNILENSLRYTDAPGRARLMVEAVQDGVRLIVEDSSPGVPEAMRSRIFERLFRVEASRSREHGGAGLGLAICQRIVQAHGGSIVAEGSELGGVRMVMVFPTHDGDHE
ncbi:HAMP domain-containing protein [Alcaligenaceae bacterium CGII-47]|nr:HAMP domain-containing protein [Alcaligenaceae bacterium CGII-47]